jgi:hypothetical protein
MRCTVLLLALLHATAAARGDDYLMVFSSDSTPYRPTNGHTFAAVAQVAESPGCPPRVTDLHSLSWLPVTRKVRALAMWCEPGRNVPLHETLQSYLTGGGTVRMWGPYRITPELAEMFRAHVASVEASYRYKAACFLTFGRICDCTRALEVLIKTDSRYIGACGYGAAASSHCVQHLAPYLIEPRQEHTWVATLLGLDRYSLTRMHFGEYRSRWEQLLSMIGW